ncbi:nipped-B-like protein B isoform X2 [Kryptolebias marmoratus]|uniref:nipped-B-like protein B isoform X2 n=1 Tax=Kryptolebias marmoratus TaxID=37003 RepID=UPI000D52F4EE|nr:nipped-B-like protein B isoform X2 [Kryptolebias marmoratus]
MNGDMPHVPITTLAGIASLTDLLNQLPLPSPLPATTAKSLLYNGRISDEVSSLLVCRDENLVTQLAHSLNQVSTEHIELKDNLGNDEPEGDMPVLLQTLLSMNPRIFRDKSMLTQYEVLGGALQQPLIQQYKISQNQVHGSPASNYQQTTVPQSPSGCFTSPQCGTATQFVPQNSPIPSPYTPQSPADYIQYNPPSYSHHQQTQQVASGVRNIHDNKVSEQLSSNSSNHNTRLGSDEDYTNVAHRLEDEENDSSIKVAAFPVKSHPACSPAGSEETAKRFRPPLIMQSPPVEVPQGAAPDLLLTATDRKKKHRDRSKEENEHVDKNVFYDIVSSPSKDSAKLTLKLSRVKVQDLNQPEELSPRSNMDSDHKTVILNSNSQLFCTPQDFSHKLEAEEQENCQQVAVQPNPKETGIIGVFDDSEIDALAEIDRIERESASERERCSKEVQDKDKPLKKRKQDTYPQEHEVETNEGPTVHGTNIINKLTPKKSSTASNGASRPALMVSIDLQHAGRIIGQPVVVLEPQPLCEDHIFRIKTNADGKVSKVAENRPEIIKQLPDTSNMSGADERKDTPKQKQESLRELRHKHDTKTKTDSDRGRSDDIQPDMTRQKHDRLSDPRHKEEKNNNSHRSHGSRPETPKPTGKVDSSSRHEEDKGGLTEKDMDIETQRDRGEDKGKLRDTGKARDKVKPRERDKDRDKDGCRDKDGDEDKEISIDKDKDRNRVKNRNMDREKDKNRTRGKEKGIDTEEVMDGNGGKEKWIDKEKDRNGDKDRDEDKGMNRNKDRNRVKNADTNGEKDKDRNRGKEKDLDREKNKDRNRGKEKVINREMDKDRNGDRDRDENKEKNREKDRNKVRNRDTDREKDKDRNRDKEKDLDREKDKGKNRDKEKELDREKDKGRNRDKDLDRERDKGRNGDKDRDEDKEINRDKDKDRNRVKNRDLDREKGKDRNRGKEKDMDREIDKDRNGDKDRDEDKEMNRDKDRNRVKNRDMDREKDKDRNRGKDKDMDKEKDRERDANRDKDGDKNRKHRTLSKEVCNKSFLDQGNKPEIPKTKYDGSRKSADVNGGQKMVSFCLQKPTNKDHNTSGDGRASCLAGSKRPATETKASELPPYLLGGSTGSLKNFVIPKLNRDGADKDLKSTLACGWSEPLVRLERVSLVETLNKTTKPIVALKRLSVEEVKRIIKDSKNAHGSRSKYWSSFENSTRGTFCERANKRRHSMISQRSKYAESDSDDEDDRKSDSDSDSDSQSARKKKKRSHDRTWKFEEKRGSRDHRRSGGFSNSRRNRDWCSDDSDESSPPPSFNNVSRKMKKKEKQKSRMMFDSMTLEEKLDSSTFKRFTSSVDNILESLEDVDLTATDDDEIPQELLLGKQQLSELGSDSAKIKAMGIFNKFSSSKLVKILNILEKNIQDSVTLSTLMSHDNDSMDEERLWRDLIMERVTKSADACLTALNIMTSPHMPKVVYLEDVIERVLQFSKFHLQSTLYPQYDPAYRSGGGTHTSKSKRAKSSGHKQKVVVVLYNKVCDIISNISELLEIQLLTDTTILQVSNLGITPFFVENVSELQLCAITLVTAVFSRYGKHRQLILEDIFTSLARLPTNKRSLRNFRLNSSDSDGDPLYIQMVSALVLQLIQCVVNFPFEKENDEERSKKVDKDVLITNSYETAMRTAQNFLSVFLKKCGSKQGEEDYRPLFENFVHDLLFAVNKPEWPAAELLLSLLGRLLVHQFSNKQTEMALRVASLDYLGTVASRLRKDALSSKMDQRAIDRILKETPGSDEVQQLQKALLDFVDGNINTDPALLFARNFYIAQWYRDNTVEVEKALKFQNENDEDTKGRLHYKNVDTTEEVAQTAEARKKFLRKIIRNTPLNFSSVRVNCDTVDYEDSCLIVRYLASMRPFAQSFDIYLSQILRVLGESAIAVRTKAMKSLSEVVAVDPSILARLDMQRGVHCRLMDNSTSVREAAVELLGRFVLSRPELIEQYYDMLIERILDTGISVRKRVIKILRDICLEHPDFHKTTEMCVKMIRRVNDEEGIKKLVNETFQKLWFSPTPSHDKEAMARKILNITDVVLACKDSGYDWFEQLLQNLLKSEEDSSYKPTKKACTQLVDNLVEHILKYEESIADCEDKGVNSGRLVACITTLYLITKIRAQFMVKHAMTMQPYLTIKCNTQNDLVVICNVAKILELVVPLMDSPSETFLNTIEEDLMKLIIKYGMMVVQHCVSCLGAIVNKVTHNYKFVWACFNRFYGALIKLKTQHQEDASSSTLAANKPTLLRSLFTVGALCRHFDFDQEEFKGANKIIIKEKVLELLLYFTTHADEEVQIKAIIGLGFQFIMHPELMFVQDIKVLYNNMLSDDNSAVSLKIQVLKNLQTYLQEEDSRMQEADREWKKQAKQEDLKEMGDISSGMSSSIMQIYLKQVLESFFHSQSTVRHFALNVVTLTLSQGLVHPVQCVPYLIAMGTDPEPTMKNKADQQLVEIDKKYSGFIHMKAVAGLKMSYQVQHAINGGKSAAIRGFRHDDSDSALCSHLYTMVRGNRQHRRAFLISLLNLFDDSSKTEVNMLLFIADNLACFPYLTQEEPLFIMHHIDITLSISGSNLLQSFKECLRKEPIRHEKKVKTKKRKKKHSRRRKNSSDEDDEDEDEEEEQSSSTSSSSDEEEEEVHRRKKPGAPDLDSDLEDEEAVMDRLPDNTTPLMEFASASQGVLLLLVLKQHLKNLYGFSDSKIQKYSPTESAKVYDKAVNRKSKVHFNPRQTLNYLKSDLASRELSYETKKNIVKQYFDFKVLMEHLDRDEEDEEGGEANANARNKAINSLLKGPKPQNHNHSDHKAPVYTDDEESEEDRPARKARRGGDTTEDSGHEAVEAADVVAVFRPKYKDRPQIAKVIQKTRGGYSIHWMTGSYSGPWAVAKKRDGRKKVPWVDTVKESDIICKKISLTSAQKLTNKTAQTLRALYAAKEAATS